jgi:nucleoside-diphosphate-sugar epimerase
MYSASVGREDTTTDGSRGPLTVAVTGPTGEIGRSFVRALERSKKVGEIRGMARRPFEAREHGWERTTYVQGDILDRAALDDFVKGADVVVHLAFIIFADDPEGTQEINLTGSRNVFEATVAAGVPRLVYTSSVAAYGFHPDNDVPLKETTETLGTDDFYYSAQKAELERTLAEVLEGSGTEAYVLRPCIVGGTDAQLLVDAMPYVQAADKLPGPLRKALGAIPLASPVLPDPGIPLQLVHTEDVATALVAAVEGAGKPGVYNLAGDGEISMSDVARAFGWHSVPIPRQAVDVLVEATSRLPFMPLKVEWLNAMRVPVVMDTQKAKRGLRWKPRHTTAATLRETVDAARAAGRLG